MRLTFGSTSLLDALGSVQYGKNGHVSGVTVAQTMREEELCCAHVLAEGVVVFRSVNLGKKTERFRVLEVRKGGWKAWRRRRGPMAADAGAGGASGSRIGATTHYDDI